MSPLPDRKTLESMRRADLQKLCKDRGLRANMKSEALIDLLIGMNRSGSSTQTQKRSSSLRIISRPPSGSSTRNRVGSMVIHDTDDEEPADDMEENPMDTDPLVQNGSTSQPSQIPVPAPAPGPAARTRMAPVGQRRLGLGRPKALGGAGLRAPQRFASTSQMKKVKTSKSVRPAELPIQEEQTPQAGPSGTTHDPPTNRSSPLTDLSSQPHSDSNLKSSRASNDAAPSFQAQLEETQAEVRRLASSATRMDDMVTSMDELRAEVAALRSQSVRQSELEAHITALREEIASLQISMSADSNRTRMASRELGGNATSSGGNYDERLVSALATTSSEDFSTHSSLGKRRRLVDDAEITDQRDADGLSAAVLATQAIRPTRKKAKLAEREPTNRIFSRPIHVDDGTEEGYDEDVPVIPPVQRGPSFTVFSGPEEPPELSSNGPPATGLSDLFPTTTPPNGTTPLGTSSAHGAENQLPFTGNNAFTFTFASSLFQPPPSTPLANLTIPVPEPPTSPSPAYVERAGGRRERNDPFYPTGRPRSRTSRPASHNAHASSSRTTDTRRAGEANASPAPTGSATASDTSEAGSLTRTGSLTMPGLVPLPVASDTPAPPTKRTMYGTELEMDTRFGDFGIEGVATMGFRWGAAPRY